MLVQLTADDVEWVVNDNAELGVKIGQQFFFCYKGHSLVYDTGAHDDGTPMMWRPVFKREFGECVRPVNYANPSRIGTVSLADSDQWKPLSAPIPPQEPTGASPQAETSRCAETCGLLRCRLNEGHSGLHQVYNAATGDFQQFIGQPAPVSPVEPTGASPQDSERAQKANGVVLVFIDERGHAIAHAADFEPQAPGGFTLIEGQRHRARRVLAGAVCAAYASPSFVRGIEPYDAQMIMDKLCRAHGCQIHEVIVGQESADV